jgi:TetR/AcrR family transcriptional repressor of lmrAB and yxaGH operons
VSQGASAKPATRERLLRAAIRLFQERGYHGVGLSEILDAADAPKGCLYHHFPAGKAELAVCAIEAIAADCEAYVSRERVAGTSAADVVRRLAAMQARWLEHKRWREAGLSSVLAQGFIPDAPSVHAALARVYVQRHARLASALREDGAHTAEGLATLVLAALDGGMVQAGATRTTEPLLQAAEQAARYIELAVVHHAAALGQKPARTSRRRTTRRVSHRTQAS